MNQRRRFERIDNPESFQRAFGVSRETIDRLSTYESLLRQWQKAVNLVAPGTLSQVWHRHLADSAQLAKLLPAEAKTLLDLGSGAGFPGLVLAMMSVERDGLKVTLLESDSRKTAFLREVARRAGVPVDILTARIENPETQRKVGQVDVVTARALAPLSRLLELAAPYLSPSGVGVFLKGREVHGEIDEASIGWRFDVELVPSMTDPHGRIVVVRNVTAKRRVEP